MDVHEIKARWDDLYHDDTATPISQRGRVQQNLARRVCSQGVVFALALALLGLIVYAISLADNVFYDVAGVVVGAALLALILYGLSVGCSERDLETARSMAAAAGVARDSRGGYEEI
jgi:hypothetical protein